jgi:type I restriction enzyme S subunit
MSSLPTGWSVRPLGDVAQTALGKMLDRGKPRGHALVPYLRNVNVQWDRIDTSDLLTMELAKDEHARFAVEKGDLLVCEGGEIGRAAIWHGRSDYIAYQKALHRVRPSPAVEARYLLHLFRHLSTSGQLAAHATGTTILHLPQQQLRRLPIPVASVEEQRRIVDILEDHFSRLDAAGEYLGAAIRRASRLRESLLAEVNNAAAQAHPSLPVGELLEHGRKVSYGVLVPGPHIDGGVPLVRVGDIHDGRVDTARLSELRRR